MLRVNDFRAYITSIKDAVEEITASETVMDNTQLSKFIDKQKTDDYLVLGIIPKHKFAGKAENLHTNDSTSILVLKKVVRSNHGHSVFLDRIDEAQAITQKVIYKLLDDYEGEENCNIMSRLIVNSFDINPIWGLNSCDGYQIDFSLNNEI
jgi:hypothetical protein